MQGNRDTQGMPERGQAAAPDQHGHTAKSRARPARPTAKPAGPSESPSSTAVCTHRLGLRRAQPLHNEQAALPGLGTQCALQAQPPHTLGQVVGVRARHGAMHHAAAAPAQGEQPWAVRVVGGVRAGQ